jgi:hypothetical protein
VQKDDKAPKRHHRQKVETEQLGRWQIFEKILRLMQMMKKSGLCQEPVNSLAPQWMLGYEKKRLVTFCSSFLRRRKNVWL